MSSVRAQPGTLLGLRRRWRALQRFVLPRMSGEYQVERARLQLERGALFAWYSLIFLGFFGLDMLQYPQHLRLFGGLRVGVVCLLGVLRLLQHRFTGLRMWSAGVFYLAACLAVAVMCIVTEGFGSIYLVGLILCLVAGCTVELLRPLAYVMVCLCINVVYLAGNLHFDLDRTPAEAASGVSFLVVAEILCIIATLVLERQRRFLFLAQAALHEKNQTLQTTLRQQREFFGKMTHELRTPLHSIKGFVELMQDSNAPDAPTQRRLALIDSSADRLLLVVTDILDLAKHEAVGLRVSTAQVAVRPLLEELVSTGRALAGQRPVSIVMELSPSGTTDGELSLYTDADRLRQVLLNLLMNAVKFTLEGQVHLRCTQRGDRVEFAVQDTGVGIPQAEQTRLFSAFAQTRAEHQRIGTGLGLNIVAQFTLLLGGTVSFVSQEGHGSTFTVSLPQKYQDG